MTQIRQGKTRTTRRLVRLMGGASIAVLAAYGPAMAQMVDITLDSSIDAVDTTTGDAQSAFTAANVTGFDTTENNTQESRGSVEATIVGGELTAGIAEPDDNTDPASGDSFVGIDGNRFEATARGNVFLLEAEKLGNGEDGTNGTLGLLTGQFADGQVRTSIANSNLTITATGDAEASSMTASDNTLAARTTINQATTVFSDDVAANLADQFAQSGESFSTANDPITLTRGDFNAVLLSTEGGDSVVASTQAVAGDGLTSEALVTDSTISIALNPDDDDNDDAGSSALTVSGNVLTATLAGNVAATGTDLDVGTTVQGAAGVFSQQQIGDGQTDSGDVALRAEVTGSSLTIDLDSADGSSLDVSENRLGAQARGNVATLDGNGLNGEDNEGTFLRVDANQILTTAAAGDTDGTVTISGDGTLVFGDGAGDPAGTGFDFVAATQQSVVSETTGSITAQNTGTSLTVTASDGNNTGGALDDSSLAIGDNTFFALASANTGGTAIELEATTITASAAVANDQNVADTDVNAFLGATEFDATTGDFTGDAVALLATIDGNVTSSSVSLDGNLSAAEAIGNVGRTDLQVTATTIDREITGESGAGEINLLNNPLNFDATADFASLNVQSQTGDITALNRTTGTVTGSGDIGAEGEGSSVSVSENVLQADAMSNVGTNRITLDGSAGINETTTALGSAQVSGDPSMGGESIEVTAALDGTFNIEAEEIRESSVEIDGNQGFAAAGSNRVTNEVTLSGNAISGGDGTEFASVGVTLEPQVGQTLEADNGVSSVQISNANITASSSLEGRINSGAEEVGIVSSAVSVSDNFARAFGMGNEGVNRLTISADTSFDGAAAVAGTQVQIGDVVGSADVSGTIFTNNADLLDSSAAIDSNIAFTRTMGNDQTNALTIDATTITGVSADDDAGTIVALGDPELGTSAVERELDGDNIVSNSQALRGSVTGEAEVTGSVLVGTGNIIDSSVSASENIAQSNVTGNRGNNLLSLDAATSVTGVSTLASEQTARGTGVIDSSAELEFTIRQGDGDDGTNSTVTSSALNVDGNLGFSSAIGNDVTNRLNASGTTVVGQNDDLSVAGISTTGVVSGTADNLLGNFQSRSDGGAVTSDANLTVNLLDQSVNDGDSLTTSSVSVRDNFLDSTATSNRARNTLALNADTALTAGGALVNSQITDSPVTSDVRLQASVGSGAFGDVESSSIALRDNTGIARASGNDAVNVLNARGSTGITGETGLVPGSTVDAGGVLNAQGTFAMASNQVNTGAVTARAGFDGGESRLEATTGALTGSSVAIGGNRLVADAVSNRVENRLTVNGSPSSEGVTTALTSRQVATGDVTSRVDATRLASLNGAVSSSSVRLNGNTLSASAGGNIATSRLTRD